MIYVGSNPSMGTQWHVACMPPERKALVVHALPFSWLGMFWIGQPWLQRIRFGHSTDWTCGVWLEQREGCGCIGVVKEKYTGLRAFLKGLFTWR